MEATPVSVQSLSHCLNAYTEHGQQAAESNPQLRAVCSGSPISQVPRMQSRDTI